MKYSEMSAIDLQKAMDGAYGTPLFEALREVERLRIVCQDIIEVIGVEYAQFGDADIALDKIDDIAHEYFTG